MSADQSGVWGGLSPEQIDGPAVRHQTLAEPDVRQDPDLCLDVPSDVERKDDARWTAHGHKRYQERTPADAPPAVKAWREATVLETVDYGNEPSVREVRFADLDTTPPSRIYLGRKEGERPGDTGVFVVYRAEMQVPVSWRLAAYNEIGIGQLRFGGDAL